MISRVDTAQYVDEELININHGGRVIGNCVTPAGDCPLVACASGSISRIAAVRAAGDLVAAEFVYDPPGGGRRHRLLVEAPSTQKRYEPGHRQIPSRTAVQR
jgi:hypothetical protein